MKRFLAIFLFLLLINGVTHAAVISKDASVAVMDLGIHPDAVPIDINILNAGVSANEYITQRIFDSNKMTVKDRVIVEDLISKEELNTTGVIDSDTARRLGELLGVKYIIYGNVNDVTLSDVGTSILDSGVIVCTVKSHIIIRMMDVETGQIIAMSKGEGKSKSSFVRMSGATIATVDVGNTKVTQDSVHNALQKAAFNAVDLLIQRLYGK